MLTLSGSRQIWVILNCWVPLGVTWCEDTCHPGSRSSFFPSELDRGGSLRGPGSLRKGPPVLRHQGSVLPGSCPRVRLGGKAGTSGPRKRGSRPGWQQWPSGLPFFPAVSKQVGFVGTGVPSGHLCSAQYCRPGAVQRCREHVAPGWGTVSAPGERHKPCSG